MMGSPHIVHTFTVDTFSCTFAGLFTAQETVTRTCLTVCCLCSCSAARIHGGFAPGIREVGCVLEQCDSRIAPRREGPVLSKSACA